MLSQPTHVALFKAAIINIPILTMDQMTVYNVKGVTLIVTNPQKVNT